MFVSLVFGASVRFLWDVSVAFSKHVPALSGSQATTIKEDHSLADTQVTALTQAVVNHTSKSGLSSVKLMVLLFVYLVQGSWCLDKG